MGGSFSRNAQKTGESFSRNAQVILKNSNTNVLQSALRNYIKAVKSLPNQNNAHIYGLMMQTANGANASYKNRIVNGVAKAVAASRRGIVQAANAVANGAPEGPAAATVKNATAKIKNLNQRIAELNTLLPPGAVGAPNNKARLYMAKKYNNIANRAINTNGKYATIWKAINTLKTENRLTAALPPRTNVPNTALVLKFLNNHKNDNVKKAAYTMAVQFKNTNLSTLALANLSNKKQEILNTAIQFKRNSNATRAARAAKKLNQNVANVTNSANLSRNRLEQNAATNQAAKNAKIQAILLKLWGHAGTGRGSESQLYRNQTALPAARANKELMNLMTNNISRANFNAVLNNPAFAPPSNNKGGARNRHTQRVKYMLRNLGWKLPTN